MDSIIPNIDGEINSVDKSMKSLVDFIDNKVIKHFDEFLEKLESAYVVYMSQVADKNIQPTSDEFKKAKVKYNQLNNSIHLFLNSITQDYMNLLQIGYRIKSLYEMLNHYSDQMNELKRKNDVDELRVVKNEVSHITTELEKLVAHYNQEITKLNFLHLNFKNKMIVYQSSSAGKTFSISLKIFNQQFDSLIDSKNSPNKNQILGKLLKQFPKQLQSVSEEPPLELLAVRPVKPRILRQPQASVSSEIVDITYSLLEPYTRKAIDPAYREHRFVGFDDSESMDSQESSMGAEKSQKDEEEYMLGEEEEEAAEAGIKIENEEASEESTTIPSGVMRQSSEEPMATEMPSTSRDYKEQAEPLIKIDIPSISVQQEYQKQLGNLLPNVNVDERIPEEIEIDNHQQITHDFFHDRLTKLDQKIGELDDRAQELNLKSQGFIKKIKGLEKSLNYAQSQIEIYQYQNDLKMVLKNLLKLKEEGQVIEQTKYKLFEVMEKLFKKRQNELQKDAQMLATEFDHEIDYEGQSGSRLEKLEKERDDLINMVDTFKDLVDNSIGFYADKSKERDMYLKKGNSLLKGI